MKIVRVFIPPPRPRLRDLGLRIGVMAPGKWNAITDVPGVKVGHATLNHGESVRTGVTVVMPHEGNLFQLKVPAAVYVGNGFGKLAGATQIEELGTIETPIVLTNTLAVGTAMDAVVEYTLLQKGNDAVQSVNAVVGETNDGQLNDIRARHIRREDVLSAIENARTGPIEEGCVGAGTGTICFGFKGGIGSSSRVLPQSLGGYAVGALAQTNFGGVLQIDGAPVGRELGQFAFCDNIQNDIDGSCMIVLATDAPLESRNLRRMAKRGFMGLARTGGIASNGSGEYVIAFSVAESSRVLHSPKTPVNLIPVLHDDFVSPLFMAAIEAAEEAIIASLFAAVTTTGKNGRCAQALPLERVIPILKAHHRIES
jgi:D-aminopeptidase